MADGDAPKRRWWRRRGAVELVTTNVCPSCNVRGPARLLPGQVCAACKAQQAWSQLGENEPLVIDRASIAEAERRRAGEAAGEPWYRRALVLVAPAITVGAAAIAGWLLVQLMSSRSIAALGTILDELATAARWTTLAGLVAVAAGVTAIVRMRRRRHYRKLALLVGHCAAVVVGATALVIGGLHWLASGGFGGQYTTMPPRESLGVPSHVDRILDATVVVLAPDASGDARNLAIGTGAVVASDPAHAWIVTCSHVAMPYAAVGTWRDARVAQPVWIQLSDGREGQGTVRWVAPPPLDVALVELPIANSPAAVPIAPDTSSLVSGRVTFVPNPYRSGWNVVHGQVIARETHSTSAGVYDLLYTDLPVTYGDSGSGLFDARGQLIGLNTWTQTAADGPARGVSLPSETMRGLVDAIATGSFDRRDHGM